MYLKSDRPPYCSSHLHESPAISAFPVSLSSPSFSFDPRLSSAPTQPPMHAHARTDTQTFAPATPAHTPILSRVFPLALGNASSQGGQDFLQSLELINSKVAANDKLWEKDNKLEMHQCLSWPGMGANENPPPLPLCPAAFRSYMCSHVSSDLYSLKQAFKAVLLTKVPGDIFKFSLVA